MRTNARKAWDSSLLRGFLSFQRRIGLRSVRFPLPAFFMCLPFSGISVAQTCVLDADCDDANPCTDDDCATIINTRVCQHSFNSHSCNDDGNPCTNDVCQNGACTHPGECTPQFQLSCCDDNNVCTTDSCSWNGLGGQCSNTNNTVSCPDDGDHCTIDVCQSGSCAHLGECTSQFQLSCCDDGNVCTNDQCGAWNGTSFGPCQHINNTASCPDDGDHCTIDVCQSGSCAHLGECTTQFQVDCCNDDNVCTTDTCGAWNGTSFGPCQHSPLRICDDPFYCNGIETCDPVSGCIPGIPPCRSDACFTRTCNEGSNSCTEVPARQVPLTIDFNRFGVLHVNCGNCGVPVTPIVTSPVPDSALSESQRTQILEKIRGVFENALPGGYAVSEGNSGTYTAVVTPNGTPAGCPGTLYGEAGRSFDPAIVYLGSFRDANGPLGGDALVNALAETIAHELGHKLGIAHDQMDPNDIMTTLTPTFEPNRRFNATGKYLIRKKFCLRSGQYAMANDSNAPFFALRCPDSMTASSIDGERSVEATAFLLLGPQAPVITYEPSRFGFMNDFNEFVTIGEGSNDEINPARLTLFHAGSIDIAYHMPPPVDVTLSLWAGHGSFTLHDPLPSDPTLYREVRVAFDADGDGQEDTIIVLRVSEPNGFVDRCSGNPFADVDDDDDVDLADLAVFARCFSGQDQQPPERCKTCFDHNVNERVDLADFTRWVACYGGPGVIADPACSE